MVGSVAIVSILVCIYRLNIVSFPKKKESNSLIAVTTLGGQLLAFMQFLAVMALLPISVDHYPNPVYLLLEVADAIQFDFQWFRLGCFAEVTPLMSFMSIVAMIFFMFFTLIVLHIGVVIVLQRGDFKLRWPALVGAFGTLMSASLTSVASSVLGPWQCYQQPHPTSPPFHTLRTNAAVTCWESEEHTMMVTISTLTFVLVPLPFISICSWAAWQSPRWLRQCQFRHMEAFQFLFRRCRWDTSWFSVCLLLRGLLISMVPMMTDSVWQITSLSSVLLASLLLTACNMPFRIKKANVTELSLCSIMVFLLVLASALMEVTNLGVMAVVVGGLMILAIASLVAYYDYCFCICFCFFSFTLFIYINLDP